MPRGMGGILLFLLLPDPLGGDEGPLAHCRELGMEKCTLLPPKRPDHADPKIALAKELFGLHLQPDKQE